jgi:glucose-1-phosphate thymidylyltransferase
LFGDGKDYGIKISYAEQGEPRGLADAFLVGEKFIGTDRVCLVLGDNIFFGHGLSDLLKEALAQKEGATVFGYYVKDPQRYGVIEFDKNNHVISIEEKPTNPKSNWAVTGLYFYDNTVIGMAKKVKPSKRGELEITDINNAYLSKKQLHVQLMGRGYAWLDTGTYDSLIDASVFIKTIEERQGLKIGCIEEIAYRMGFIDVSQVRKFASQINTSYGEYLKKILQEG